MNCSYSTREGRLSERRLVCLYEVGGGGETTIRGTHYRAGREGGATDGHICDKCIQLIPSSLNPIKECGKQDSSHVPA